MPQAQLNFRDRRSGPVVGPVGHGIAATIYPPSKQKQRAMHGIQQSKAAGYLPLPAHLPGRPYPRARAETGASGRGRPSPRDAESKKSPHIRRAPIAFSTRAVGVLAY